MSYGLSCVLDWPGTDIERVRATVEAAVADCARVVPDYANTRIEVDADTIHLFFPRSLVDRKGGELVRTPPKSSGSYHCTFDHRYDKPMALAGGRTLPAETHISISSQRNDNQHAWGTATKVLARVTELLGGRTFEF